MEGIKVERLWLYASNSKNKFKRLLAMLSYSFSLTWFFLWHRLPKTVIVQSPPLLVAFTCMFFLKLKKRQLILNVSDLWPIAGLELGALKKGFYYRFLERIEIFNYKTADLILGQSQEILNHVLAQFPHKRVFLYRNYPQFDLPQISNKNDSKNSLKVVYAGLLGVAQGIFDLCQHLDYAKFEFHIYGSGAEAEDLQKFIAEHSTLPLYYHGQLEREQLHKELLNYDLAIIPLVKRIYGSVPSKIFEYAKLGLPVLYCGGGEGESIVRDTELGWVATPGNYFEINHVLNSLESPSLKMREKIRQTSSEEFDFNVQLERLKTFL